MVQILSFCCNKEEKANWNNEPLKFWKVLKEFRSQNYLDDIEFHLKLNLINEINKLESNLCKSFNASKNMNENSIYDDSPIIHFRNRLNFT